MSSSANRTARHEDTLMDTNTAATTYDNSQPTTQFNDAARGNPTYQSGAFPATGATTSPSTGANFPPTSATQTNTSTDPSYPSMKTAKHEARVGKVQTTIGKVFHSSSMKAKGEAHLANADALTGQFENLQEAEALEAQAKVHRDRGEAHRMAADAITGSGGEQGPGRYDVVRTGGQA
ncbi:hypothetical protein DL93DRAFT_2168785 [Clavulina sp. PMI_390]|nr:hypothetical protein DL93DRAFT_2168785 [Clavulina sp. PMI_390]